MTCEICDLIKSKKGKLYEDEKVIALIAPKPATVGHVIITPKKHVPILEQVPDYVASELFAKANKISMALFEGLGAQGTNLLIQNGVAAGQKHNHLLIHVMPRRENDGIDFMWKPKQLSEEEMSTIEMKIKDETKGIGSFEKEPEKKITIEEKKPEEISEEEDYMLKQLERLP